MKHILKLCCGMMALLSAAACNNDEWEQTTGLLPSTDNDNKVCITAYAAGNNANTRVEYSAEGNTFSLAWEDEESFSIMRGEENKTFSKNTEGNNFTGTMPTAGTGNFYAFYPVTTATTPTAVALDLTTQTGALNSNCTYMRASSADGELFEFEHCTAILKAAFSGLPADATISEVIITSTKASTNPTINLTDGTLTDGTSKTVTIAHTTPVATDALHYIYLPPMAQTDAAFEFTAITSAGDYSGTLNATKNIESGKLYTATIAMKKVPPYLTFTATGMQTFKIMTINNFMYKYYLDESLQYSLDGGEWTKLTANTEITFGGEDSNLRLRGKSSGGMAENELEYSYIVFGNNTPVTCTGDIRTLVDYENFDAANTSEARFCSFFKNCTALQTAPELPATTLAERCYASMFSGCDALQTAPKLPATTLAERCYENMFLDCTALETAPVLPATTLAESCYASMFSGCDALQTAPKLPATTLTKNCYNSMFYSCDVLQTAPVLPATTLTESCYRNMFGFCKALQTAPELPVTTLAESCYWGMFQNCKALQTAPVLPATTLTKSCYDTMFMECTALKTAPTLPAETLAEKCYYQMFANCTALKSITMLATDINAYDCLSNWVYGVAATGTFTKAAEMELLPEGNNGIPSGWSIVEQ